MKKRFLLGLLLSTFALASCGKNKETTTETNDIVEDNTDVENENALSKRVNKLCKNIEKLPNTSDVFNNNTSLSYLSDPTDYSRPNSTYNEYPSYNTYYENLWKLAEGLKDRGLEVKDMSLEYVKEYDKWIEMPNGDRYMVSYDKVLDEVHVKKLNDNLTKTLIEITSGYTPDGKVSIKVNSYYEFDTNEYNDSQWSVETLSYVEGQKWYFTYKLDRELDNTPDVFSYVVESDLINNKVTQLYFREYLGDYDGQTHLETEVSVQDKKNDLLLIAGSNADGPKVRIFDKNGHDLIRVYNQLEFNTTLVSFDLFNFNELESASYVRDNNAENFGNASIVINGKECAESAPSPKDGIQLHYYFDATGGSSAPFVEVRVKNTLDLLDSIKYALSYENLTWKEGINTDNIYSLLTEAQTIVKEREALGFVDFTNITKDQIIDAYNRYNLNKYTRESFLALFKEQAVNFYDQKEDSDLYINVDSTFTGTPIFDEENITINLKNVTASVKKNSLLSTSKKYKAVVLLQDKSGYKILASSNEVQYDNQDISFTFNDEAINILNNLSSANEYSLAVCIGSVEGESISAISSKSVVSFEVTNKKILLNHFEDDTRIEDEYLIINTDNGTVSFSYLTEIEMKPEPEEAETE